MSSLSVDCKLKSFSFMHNIKDANVHWFFEQAIRAYDGELYLASALSYITGIEALLRKAAKSLEDEKNNSHEYLSSTTLSNNLLKKIHEKGIDIKCFKFSDESCDDFFNKINDSKKGNVRIVKLRHDLNHGNIKHFIQETDESEKIFTPDMLQGVCKILEPMALEFLKNLKGSKL